MSHLELHAAGLPVFFPATATAFIPHEGAIHAHFDQRPWTVDETADQIRALLGDGSSVALDQLLTTCERLIAHPALPRIERVALISGMRGTILAALGREQA